MEIKTIQQLNALITNTYILSIIEAVVFVSIALIIANLIAFQGSSEDNSYKRRRIWFFVIWFFAIAGFFCYNNFVVMERIKNIAFQSKFMNCIAVSSGIVLIVYGVLSFIIMKFFPKSKFGTILFK